MNIKGGGRKEDEGLRNENRQRGGGGGGRKLMVMGGGKRDEEKRREGTTKERKKERQSSVESNREQLLVCCVNQSPLSSPPSLIHLVFGSPSHLGFSSTSNNTPHTRAVTAEDRGGKRKRRNENERGKKGKKGREGKGEGERKEGARQYGEEGGTSSNSGENDDSCVPHVLPSLLLPSIELWRSVRDKSPIYITVIPSSLSLLEGQMHSSLSPVVQLHCSFSHSTFPPGTRGQYSQRINFAISPHSQPV